MTVGERVKICREKKGLSQRTLSRECGVSQPTISAIENATKAPSTETISLIAKALGCTVAELMGEDAGHRDPSDNELKFALFGGDAEEITDAQFEEVKRFARFIKERDGK